MADAPPAKDGPTLEAMLEDLPDHHLRRTVAERWDLKVPRDASRDEVLDLLLSSMRSPARIDEVATRLYGDMRRVLYHLALLDDGRATSSDVAEDVFQGDLWRTKQSLEELHNYQLVHLARIGDLQGAYPEYRATVPADLREPLRQALDLSVVGAGDLLLDAEPTPVHRAGYDALRDLVCLLALAGQGRVRRTQAGHLRKRTIDDVADLLTDPDPDRIELLVGAAETLGLLVEGPDALDPNRPAVDAFLEGGPGRAQGLLLAGALRQWVPDTNATVGEVLWVVAALDRLAGEAVEAAEAAGAAEDASDGAEATGTGPDSAGSSGGGDADDPHAGPWLDRAAALRRVRLEGLSRDFRRWFARSLREARALLDTVASWLGLVDRGGPDDGALRVASFARALLGAAPEPVAEEGRVVVDPNLEVHLFQDPPDPARLHAFLRFADPLHLGPASRFKLGREALWRGLADDDLELDDVLATLGDEVPGNVEETLTGWAAHLQKVDLGRAWLLEVRDADLLDDLLGHDEVADRLDRLGPRHARVRDPARVGRFLKDAGWVAELPKGAAAAGSGRRSRSGAGTGRGEGGAGDDGEAGPRRQARFQRALEELVDALGVGLPAWLGGDAARFEEFYEADPGEGSDAEGN